MWSLRPASNFIKNQKSSLGFHRLFHVRSEMKIDFFYKRKIISRSSCIKFDRGLPWSNFCLSRSIIPSDSSLWKQTFSSQTVSKSSGKEDELQDVFSELDVPVEVPASNIAQMEDAKNVNDDNLVSDTELFEVGEDSENINKYSHDGSVAENKVFYDQAMISEFFRLVADHNTHPFDVVLSKWIEDGNDLNEEDISQTMFALRKLEMNEQALKLSWWLQKSKKVDFKEHDYAIRVDLIAKLHGIEKAEKYIEIIPKPFQGEVIYRTLLSNSVLFFNVKRAEEIFNKMKDDLKFPLSTFTCNQLLSLYRGYDRKKIAEVLVLMETQNLKPTLQTFKTLIDAKGRGDDINGMDRIFEAMRSQGIKPDMETYSLLARHYITRGHKQKAEVILKALEKENIQDRRGVCQVLFPLYAALSKPDDIKRLWSSCQKNPFHGETLAAMDAWGTLKNVEEAEAIFHGMLKKCKRATASQYYVLLKVYADNKECEKGKKLLKQMADNGIEINSWSWDTLVNVLLDAGEVEKADSALERLVSLTGSSPSLSTYVKIMRHYASAGDVHKCERIFLKCKQLGSKPGILSNHFQVLMQAYVNSKMPAYGMRERLKVDNVPVTKTLEELLNQIDEYKKAAGSD